MQHQNINISKELFNNHLSELEEAKSQLKNIQVILSHNNIESKVFMNYQNKFKQLESLIISYINLLEQDLQLINYTKDKLFETDSNLGLKIKSSISEQ